VFNKTCEGLNLLKDLFSLLGSFFKNSIGSFEFKFPVNSSSFLKELVNI
jgi:hypothetical protein